MQFRNKPVPDSLRQRAREYARSQVTFTPEDLRRHLERHEASALASLSALETDWRTVSNRVTRDVIRELQATHEIGSLKRGVWARKSFLDAAAKT